MDKETFVKLYYYDLESLSTISIIAKQNKTTLSYKATKVWGLKLRTKAEAAIIAYKKNRKDNSGIKNGRFIDDGLCAKERSKVKSYDISAIEYLKMRSEQNCKCKICGKTEKENGKKLAIDHCHKTNKVRGLLCSFCNKGIGFLMDDVNILEEAIKYLNESKEVYWDNSTSDNS